MCDFGDQRGYQGQIKSHFLRTDWCQHLQVLWKETDWLSIVILFPIDPRGYSTKVFFASSTVAAIARVTSASTTKPPDLWTMTSVISSISADSKRDDAI